MPGHISLGDLGQNYSGGYTPFTLAPAKVGFPPHADLAIARIECRLWGMKTRSGGWA